MKSIFCIVIIFFGVSFSEDEAVTKVATSAANWLKIDNGVRGISMGGSQVASGRGMTGAHYNPASIAFLGGSEFFYSKSNYLADISHNTLAYGTRLTPTDYFGLHLFYLHSGDMKVTTEAKPDGTGETFQVTDLSLRLIYGRQLTDRLRLGGALKYIREDIFTAYIWSSEDALFLFNSPLWIWLCQPDGFHIDINNADKKIIIRILKSPTQ